MQVVRDPQTAAAILESLTIAGFINHSIDREGFWVVTGAQGYLHGDGRRYWGVDVSGMLPVYQDLYERIFEVRLQDWGAAQTDDAGVLRAGGLILYWGPDALMRAASPAAVARRRLQAGDEDWVTWLEDWWHQTAAAFEDHLDRWWAQLVAGRTDCGTFCQVVQAKVRLTAIGVDALIPSERQLEADLAAIIPSESLDTVLRGCYLPASGYVAYDQLEWACWCLADAIRTEGRLGEPARRWFIRDGLFSLYHALNTDQKSYYFHAYPLELAQRYADAAQGKGMIAAQMAEALERPWRRRLHRQRIRQRLEAIPDPAARGRLLVLLQFIGMARDYDEEKRRLNAKFWRGLVALADGLQLSLARAGLVELRMAIESAHGQVSIDNAFVDE